MQFLIVTLVKNMVVVMKNNSDLVVNNRIKVYRAKQDLTQEELAEMLGVTRQTIIAIESGKYLPSLGLALKIAQAFEAKIEDIFVSSK